MCFWISKWINKGKAGKTSLKLLIRPKAAHSRKEKWFVW
jgi:hypothetical protein